MRLIFLGTGGYHPSERRHTAGILFPHLGLLLDAGTGTFRVPSRLRTPDLTIALTHAHLDHVCGLTYLLVELQLQKIRRLRIIAMPAVIETIHQHLFAERLFPVMPTVEWQTLEEGVPVAIDSGTELRHCLLRSHPGGSCGYRIDWRAAGGHARSVAAVTDTTVDGTYTEFIRGADLLIHECYFRDEDAHWARKTGHSHTSQVARLAQEAGVGRLLLTHLDPQRGDDDPVDLSVARAIFPRTELAEDLLEVDV
jgi:ribonuclease BN (tRNA processing enzyme)